MAQMSYSQEEEFNDSENPLIRHERDLEMAASGIKGAAVGAVAGFKGGKVIYLKKIFLLSFIKFTKLFIFTYFLIERGSCRWFQRS